MAVAKNLKAFSAPVSLPSIRFYRGCLIRFGTAVIELVEICKYCDSNNLEFGGFDKLNHRITYLLDIPLPWLQEGEVTLLSYTYNFIGDGHRLRFIMSNHYGRKADFFLPEADLSSQTVAQVGIKGRKWLVQKN